LNISGDKGDPPKELQVEGCLEQPCVVRPGGDVRANVDFVASKINCFFCSM